MKKDLSYLKNLPTVEQHFATFMLDSPLNPTVLRAKAWAKGIEKSPGPNAKLQGMWEHYLAVRGRINGRKA